MHGFVQYFLSVVSFTRLFRNGLLNLDLTFTHKDPAYRYSLEYVDGNLLFNELRVHMTKLENFNFCIETACLCNQQMHYVIKSFQTQVAGGATSRKTVKGLRKLSDAGKSIRIIDACTVKQNGPDSILK
ncbi:unnamed protein product [Rotaria sp. Silwood2]|nr:unnamed protein product [Rotaria sp. Silwood2]CAF4475027.1 unnamed protein product [Rotaria sp. Silwood2]